MWQNSLKCIILELPKKIDKVTLDDLITGGQNGSN